MSNPQSDPLPNPSPGPGWWLASDGKWYPQQWEYTYISNRHKHAGEAVEWVAQQAAVLGKPGWELVNYTVQMATVGYAYWFATAIFKRPLAP
jgi:hypothetical protein